MRRKVSSANEIQRDQTNLDHRNRRMFLPQTFGGRVAATCWTAIRTVLFRPSLPVMNRWRVFLLHLFGAQVAESAVIHPSVLIHFPWNLTIRSEVQIFQKVIINCMGPVEIGERTRISQYAHLCAGTHEYQRRDMRIRPCYIKIGHDVWVAADAFVGPDVRIGDGTIVGARAGVFGNLPKKVIAVGEPARAVCRREQDGLLPLGTQP